MTRTAVVRGAAGVLIVALATALLVAAGSPASAGTVHRSAEAEMVAQINRSRAAYGLPKLTLNAQMTRHGRAWARRMAAEGRVYHRPNLADVVDGNYDRLADNVGYTALEGASSATLVSRLHQAFMASTGHRAQILGRYNQVGVGIHRGSDGRMWVAVNFVTGPLGGFPLYRDVDGSSSEQAIERLFLRGAVRGCTRTRFCATSTSSRTYAATVIDRATGTRRASYSVAGDCGSDWYCRNADVTRRQLAFMVAAAGNLDPVWGAQFTDIRSDDHGVINAVVRAGLMRGCDTARFCPRATVTRAQIASVVNRAVN